jgi:hypothetical protein
MLNFITKRIGVFLIIGIVFTVFSPWLFTRNLGLIGFHSTGDIGSTIGGITAPITSLIGALLIYCALDAQKKANKIQSENNATQTLLSLILDLEKKCYDLVFIAENNHHRTGIAAFNSISSILYYRDISHSIGKKVDKYNNGLLSSINFGNYYNIITNASLILDFVKSAEVDKFNKSILEKRFQQIFDIFLDVSLRRLEDFYTEDRSKGRVESDYYFEDLINIRHKIKNQYSS